MLNSKKGNNRVRSLFYTLIETNVIIIALIIGAFAFIALGGFRYYLIQNITAKDQILHRNIEEDIEEMASAATDVLKYVDQATKDVPQEKVNELIRSINQVNPSFKNIEILDQSGDVIATLPEYSTDLGFTRSGEAFYKAIKSGMETYWGIPIVSSTTGDTTVTISIKASERIIVGYLDLHAIQQVIQKSNATGNVYLSVVLLDQFGRYISGPDMSLAEQRRVSEDFPAIRAQSADLSEESYYTPDRMQILYTDRVEGPDWYVALYDDYGETLNVYRPVYYLIGVALFTVALFAFLGSYSTSKKVENEIQQFIKYTVSLSSGQYDSPIPNNKFREFNYLASNMNQMAQSILERDRSLHTLAYYDSLTGLYSRTALNQDSLLFLKEDSEAVSLIYIDLDDFKSINDSFGHSFGDKVLSSIAERILSLCDNDSTAFRFGGDEFVILVNDSIDGKRALDFAKSAIDSTRTNINVQNREVNISLSAGICTFTKETIFDFELMLQFADIALYNAKRKGKGVFCVYEPTMDVQQRRATDIKQSIRSAIAKGELYLCYQPQLHVHTSTDYRLRGFEALLRWNSSEFGLIPPDEFIPLAEETGIISQIGLWVFKEACRFILSTNRNFNSNYVISINISPKELIRADFVESIKKIVHETEVQCNWLELEITESVLLEDIEVAIRNLTELRDIGISISMDDFGTGFSSLSYIHQLPINTLKIDRSFVSRIDRHKISEKMVESISLLATNLELILVAEGIETLEQANKLLDLGCHVMQGFYFSKPIEGTGPVYHYIETVKAEHKDSQWPRF